MKGTTTSSEKAQTKKGLNIKKIGAIVFVAIVIGLGVYAFGFTTKGRTMVRVMIDPAPAVDAYAAKDAYINGFKLQVASPKE